MTFSMFEWISVTEAIRRAGISERTVRRWIKDHELNSNCIRKDGRNILLNALELSKDYMFEQRQAQAGSDRREEKTTQMQIVSYSETINKLSEQIERRDEEIKLLLSRKSKIPFWLTTGFIVAILVVLVGLYIAFNGYINQLFKMHNNELSSQADYYQRVIDIKANFFSKQLTALELNSTKIEQIQASQIADLKKEIKELKDLQEQEHKPRYPVIGKIAPAQ